MTKQGAAELLRKATETPERVCTLELTFKGDELLSSQITKENKT